MTTMNIVLKSALGVFTLALFGAGCSQTTSTPVTTGTSSDAYAQTNTQVSPSATTSTDSDSSTTTTIDMTGYPFSGAYTPEQVNDTKVRIKTTKGDIVIQLSYDMGPLAASNFRYLVDKGFYNGTIFHRVIPGFMIQGGDPDGTGMGGPGYKFANDEVKSLPTKTIQIQGQSYTGPVYEDGLVAMANAGRNTNGSQFFIMVADYPLPPDYSVFGKVVEGLDIAHAIANAPRDYNDRPNEEIKMISVSVEK